MQRDRRTCREDSAEPIQPGFVLFAVPTDTIPHGGRAIGLGCLPGVESFENVFGAYKGGPCGVHIRNDGGDLHCKVEESKERKAGHIDFTGLDVVVFAEQVNLCIEHLVFVDDAFWRSGAAARKDDGSGIGGHCVRERSGELAAGFDELFVGGASKGQSFGCDDDVELRISVAPRHKFSECVDWRDGDETMWVDFVETAEDAGFSHAGIDEHTDSAGAEDGEGQGNELDGGADHENEAVSGSHAELHECACSRIDITVELQEGGAGPCRAISVIPGKWSSDGSLVWDGQG